MSYAPINPEENQQAPTGQTTNNPAGQLPPQVSGSVGAGQTGGAIKGATSGSPTQFGSSASKLGDYLSANAPQITNQANTLAGNLNTQYKGLNEGITKAANDFQSQVGAGYAAPVQGTPNDSVQQAMADPYKYAYNPDKTVNQANVDAFRGQYNNAYTGPTNFEGTGGYSDIQNQVGQAVQQGGLLGTQAGLQSYLQGKGNNPTKASATLDTLLMQGNPEAQATINKAAGQFSGLTGQLGTATQGADQSVLDAQKAAQESSNYAKSQFDPFAQKFGAGLGTQLAGVNANRDAYNTAVTGNQNTAQGYQQQLLAAQQGMLFPSNTGSPASDAAAKAQVQGYYQPGYDSQLSGLAPYLSGQPITQPWTLANTATAGQYGEDAALAQLLGTGYTPQLNQADIGQAGSYAVPGMPGAIQDPSGQIQYMGDLSSLYSNPGIGNIGGVSPGKTPAQLAQQAISHGPGQGWNVNAAQQAALARLAANQYAGR